MSPVKVNLKEESCSMDTRFSGAPPQEPQGLLGGERSTGGRLQAGWGRGACNTSLWANSSNADLLAVAPDPLPTCQVSWGDGLGPKDSKTYQCHSWKPGKVGAVGGCVPSQPLGGESGREHKKVEQVGPTTLSSLVSPLACLLPSPTPCQTTGGSKACSALVTCPLSGVPSVHSLSQTLSSVHPPVVGSITLGCNCSLYCVKGRSCTPHGVPAPTWHTDGTRFGSL